MMGVLGRVRSDGIHGCLIITLALFSNGLLHVEVDSPVLGYCVLRRSDQLDDLRGYAVYRVVLCDMTER
jgi:hypothetical protein